MTDRAGDVARRASLQHHAARHVARSLAATAALIASASPGVAQAVDDIHDIRGPKYIMPAWLIPALIAAIALLAWAGYALWRKWRRHREPRVLLSYELALQRLAEIRALMQPEHAREFSIAVSDIVRRYIEMRFDLVATHRTTEEFLHELLDSTHSTLAAHRALLSEFLNQCDLAKFAGMALTRDGMQTLHDSARVFVEQTAKAETA